MLSNIDSANFDWKAIFLQNDWLILRRYVSYMLHISFEWSVKNILRHTTKWSEYFINSVNNVSSEQLMYVSDYKSSYSFTTHYANHVSSSSMCFAPSQSYRQNVATPQLWLWLVFLMHGTHHSCLYKQKLQNDTNLVPFPTVSDDTFKHNVHELSTWIKHPTIFMKYRSISRQSYHTKNINHAGIRTRRTQRIEPAAPTIEAYGTTNSLCVSFEMNAATAIDLSFIIGRPRLQSWKSSTWVSLQKTWKYSE